MNTQANQANISVDKIREIIEDYTATVHALQSFIGLLTWNDKSNETIEEAASSLGRKMDTSHDNSVSPSTIVTPDAVIQRNDRIGYVVEAKKSLPSNSEHWRKVVDQLRKYDDDLLGWWTDSQKMETACVALLLEISRVSKFARYLEKIMAEESWSFERPTSVIEFTRTVEVKEYIWLRKSWGSIVDLGVLQALEDGKKIPREKIIGTYGEKKFYDSQPITELTMSILWQDIFNDLRFDTEYDEVQKAWLLTVNTEVLAEELQRLYGSTGFEEREATFPTIRWVREAMDAFVEINLATPSEDGQEYVVHFKRIRTDLMERFVKHRISDKGRAGGGYEQLSLWDEG